jgi:hypothetical protein
MGKFVIYGNPNTSLKSLKSLVEMKGFEPSTPALRTRCSPAELHPLLVQTYLAPLPPGVKAATSHRCTAPFSLGGCPDNSDDPSDWYVFECGTRRAN